MQFITARRIVRFAPGAGSRKIVIMTQRIAKPIIKWAGGKGGLLAQYTPYFPPAYHRYFEPFVGSAAVFFHLQPPQSFLFDSNRELVEVYQVLRDDVESLISALSEHRYDKEHYYAVRAQNPA